MYFSFDLPFDGTQPASTATLSPVVDLMLALTMMLPKSSV